MTQQVSYIDLLDSMPSFTGGLPSSDVRGIETGLHANPTYVSPDLLAPGEWHESPVVLLMAPGAMGKSEAARAAASHLNCPYVNLAEMRVGTGSLTGELTKALGSAFPAFVESLKAGKASLVLDSTDEALLAAGAENYHAFLGDVAWLLIDAVPMNQILFLGRRDATDSTYVLLDDVGYRAPVFELAPLNEEKAATLIDLALDGKTVEGKHFTTHRVHPEPFSRLRSALFLDVSKALEPALEDLSSWSSVDYFLGYPPVLLAISERLAVDNPAQELADFERTDTRERGLLRGVLLRGIVEKILDRESAKVRVKICEALAIRPESPEASVLYSREEQVTRLLGITGPMQITPTIPAVLSETEHGRYEELLGPFVQDHPFLHTGSFANVVFSDYARAWAVSSPLADVYANSRREFLAALPNVGPFFASFVHALTTSTHEHSGRIREDLVGSAIRSNALGTNAPLAFYAEQGGVAHLGLMDQSAKAIQNSLNFKIDASSGVVEFLSPISNITCIVENGVILKGIDGRVEYGPNAAIIAGDVEIDGRSFVVLGASSADESWSFISSGAMSHDGELKVNSYADGAQLGISWPDPWFQWKDFEMDLSSTHSLTREVSSQVLLGLRRLLTSFGSSVKNDPSVSADKVDRILVGTNLVFRATLNSLLSLEVIAREESLYRLNLSVLGDYGVSYTSLRGDDPSILLATLFSAATSTTAFTSTMATSASSGA